MNERQSYVVGAGAVFLIIAVLFFVPWRVGRADDIRWAPLYRAPVTYVSTYMDETVKSSFKYEKGRIALDILLLELLCISVVSSVLYFVLGSDEASKEDNF